MTLSRPFGIFLVGLIGFGVFVWLVALYYTLVTKEENVVSSWTQVELTYQMRTDLIQSLLKITENVPPLKNDTEALRKDLEVAHQEIEGAVSHLFDENYMHHLYQSQLKLTEKSHQIMDRAQAHSVVQSSEEFSNIKAQMKGFENRITDAKKVFNDSVSVYNAAIDIMPTSFVATMNNFKRKAYFKSNSASDTTENIHFEIKD